MNFYKIVYPAVIFLFVNNAQATSNAGPDRDWRFSIGMQSGGRPIEWRARISSIDDGSEFEQDAGWVSGVEFALARRIWDDWRIMGYYTLMTGEEEDAWGVTIDGEPSSVEMSSKCREQRLGVEMVRSFQWGENWAPYLGLGTGISRFRSHMYVNLASLSGTEELVSNDIPPDTEWFYSGVAGIEYLFGESWSSELELRHIGFPGGNRYSKARFNAAIRVAYRF